jgi:tryptophanyl-tRNA synthetase
MSPGVLNLFEILKACGKTAAADELLQDYNAGNLKYSKLKEVVADALVELTSNLRTRRDEIEKDTTTVNKQVKEMSEKARGIAAETLREVRNIIGLPPTV